MSEIAPALAALQSGDRERARSILVQAFDRVPGDASAMLAQMALDDGDPQRAEALARTAIENYTTRAAITLADAVGRQGRRAEAERIALDAMSTHADSGLLRAVLGEQRIRQAKWDLGSQDYVDALSFEDREAVFANLWRVMRDLTIGHRADKVPYERATGFIDRLEGSVRLDDQLRFLFRKAREAVSEHTVLPPTPPRIPKSAPPAPAPQQRLRPSLTDGGAGSSTGLLSHAGPAPLRGHSPDLVAVMRRDRDLNEGLQSGLELLGLPQWPSDNTDTLDTIPEMVPKNLSIDREEFQREHLNVTSGSVASEIIIQRSLESLLQEISRSTASAPRFDDVGLTQLEFALWDGALDRMRPIPQVYLAERTVDARTLAIGAFLGACVINPGDATWTFDREPSNSTIETVQQDLAPFDFARKWIAAEDKDDVHLEEFLDDARLVPDLQSKFLPRHDPTHGLTGEALSMKLAEQWMQFRMHPLDTAQNDVAAAIRPLNVMDDIIFFALAVRFAPFVGAGQSRGEVAVAYVRDSGEFLLMTSRKHFARAVGVLCKRLNRHVVATIADLFASFHNPRAKVFNDPERQPRLERRGNATLVRFVAQVGDELKTYGLVHSPDTAVEWRLLEV